MNQDRILGAWMGMAVGNALGAPLESLWENQIQIKLGRVTEMIGGGWLDLRPGETSTDVAFAGAAAQAITENGAFDPAKIAQAYRAVLAQGPHDISSTLRAAYTLWDEGCPPEEVAEKAREVAAEDEGTAELLVRAVPFALRHHACVQEVIQRCVQDARLTHTRGDAAAGAAAAGALVASALEAQTPAETLTRADEALESTGEDIENLLPHPQNLDESRLEPTEPDAARALEVVVFEVARAKSFERAVIRTINRGGTSDVTGALCGAVLGALWGQEAIPERWMRALVERRAWRKLGQRLA